MSDPKQNEPPADDLTPGRYRSVFRPGIFAGHTILITGGGTGIGRCTAHELAALGAKVVIAGRRTEPLQRTSAEINADGGDASWVALNIRDAEAVDSTIAQVVADHGPLYGLVNNAGGQFASPAAAIRPKGWRAVVDTNLNGTWFVSQAVFKHSFSPRRLAQGGAIVNVVADMWNGFPGMAHTGAARAGVVNLTKSLAREWAIAGVRVNAVAPGYILSSGLATYPAPVKAIAKKAFADNPWGRPGTEGEVSAAITFLLSPAAAFITGDTTRVDGAGSLEKGAMMPLPRAKANPRYQGLHRDSDIPETFLELLGPALDDELSPKG